MNKTIISTVLVLMLTTPAIGDDNAPYDPDYDPCGWDVEQKEQYLDIGDDNSLYDPDYDPFGWDVELQELYKDVAEIIKRCFEPALKFEVNENYDYEVTGCSSTDIAITMEYIDANCYGENNSDTTIRTARAL